MKPASRTPRSRSWILVADADHEVALEISRHLSRQGFFSYATSWGLRALAAVTASRPALAIVDVQLQDMTGHALVAGLRDLDARVPVVVTCADDDALGQEVRAREAGIVYFATKPLDLARLATVVRSATASAPVELSLT